MGIKNMQKILVFKNLEDKKLGVNGELCTLITFQTLVEGTYGATTSYTLAVVADEKGDLFDISIIYCRMIFDDTKEKVKPTPKHGCPSCGSEDFMILNRSNYKCNLCNHQWHWLSR